MGQYNSRHVIKHVTLKSHDNLKMHDTIFLFLKSSPTM